MKKIFLIICLSVFSVLAKAQVADTTSNNDPKKVWVKVDKEPQFPGGMEHLFNYLMTNLKYPEEAKKNGLSGKVFVGFVVEKDGSLTDIKVIKGVSPELDAEAIRLIKDSPKWRPGSAGGVPCRVQYNLPINFQLPQ
ncbi:MAG TPA: energy transducer TonB [Mucilaginibacter sp.]|jgi:protein TonB|nr:energy transducer TonB [Mucilaginibacter sp.]